MTSEMALPIASTYCALVHFVEQAQRKQAGLLLDNIKSEDALQKHIQYPFIAKERSSNGIRVKLGQNNSI